MKWFTHPACQSRGVCAGCRGSEKFRQSLVTRGLVDTRDFACPHGMDKMGLGDLVALVATPIARALKLPCIDPATKELRPESGCAKRKAKLNQL